MDASLQHLLPYRGASSILIFLPFSFVGKVRVGGKRAVWGSLSKESKDEDEHTTKTSITTMRILTTTALLAALFYGTALASTPESSTFVSVRALDEYGNSEQIQNAQKAATLQGTLVVAARDPAKNSTIVLSLLDKPRAPGLTVPDRTPSMLQLIHRNPSFVRNTKVQQTAMVCTCPLQMRCIAE